jgi:hypothetical protein
LPLFASRLSAQLGVLLHRVVFSIADELVLLLFNI